MEVEVFLIFNFKFIDEVGGSRMFKFDLMVIRLLVFLLYRVE